MLGSSALALAVFLIFTSAAGVLPWPILVVWIGITLSLGFLWFKLFARLKWLGLSEDFWYVSNYLNSYRYTYDSIAGIEEENFGPFRRIRLFLHHPGQLGQEIEFFASYYWYVFLQHHPDILRQVLGEVLEEDEVEEA